MKKEVFILTKKWFSVSYFALLFTSAASAQATADREVNKKAIMETIQRETDCAYSRDYDCWKETFVRDQYSSEGWSNRDDTFDVKVGWDSVNASIEKFMKENPVPLGYKRRVERRNVQYKFYADLACYDMGSISGGPRRKEILSQQGDQGDGEVGRAVEDCLCGCFLGLQKFSANGSIETGQTLNQLIS